MTHRPGCEIAEEGRDGEIHDEQGDALGTFLTAFCSAIVLYGAVQQTGKVTNQ
jgi:hypothetical protein